MALVTRQDFSGGWNPSQDAYKGDPRALLRADNLVLDEQNALTLRRGSSRIGDPASGGEQSVHSIASHTIDFTRYRIAGIDDSVYVNGSRVASGVAGSGTIHITSMLRRIFFARGSTRTRYNPSGGTANWGIAEPTLAPTLSALAPFTKSICPFGSAESSKISASEGSVATGTGPDGVANSAHILTMDNTTKRGSLLVTLAAPIDLSKFAGDAGDPNDCIEFKLWIGDPLKLKELESITVMIDVGSNAADGAQFFKNDYYYYTINRDEVTGLIPDNVAIAADLAAPDSTRVESSYKVSKVTAVSAETRHPASSPVSKLRPDAQSSSSLGWQSFSVPRASWQRVGASNGNGWSNARAVKLTAVGNAASGTTSVGIASLQLSGGSTRALTGTFIAHYIFVRNTGDYVIKSGASPVSSEITLKNNGLQVSVPAAALAAMDTQTSEIWIFLLGGGLDRWYRFATTTALNTPTSVGISTVAAATINIVSELNNRRPPEDITAILGVLRNRMLVCTSKQLCLSRINNPDSYDLDQRYKIGDGNEYVLWGCVSDTAAFVGTTRTIYRVSGSLAEFPDGTVDIHVEDIGVDPPTSECLARDGEVIVYLGAEGLMSSDGGSSRPIKGSIDLIQQGKTRYGVPGWNLGLQPSLCRAALLNRFLYVLAPEVATYQTAIYRYNLDTHTWARLNYFYDWDATRAWCSMTRENNGLIIAGDNKGQIWQLETGDTDDGHFIPVDARFVYDPLGLPLQLKHGFNVSYEMESSHEPIVHWYVDSDANAEGGGAAFAHALGQGSPSRVVMPFPTTSDADIFDFRALSLRIGGSFTSLSLRSYSVEFRPRPIARAEWDSGNMPISDNDLVWVRRIKIMLRGYVGGSVNIACWIDGVQLTPDNVVLAANIDTTYDVKLGRRVRGRQLRICVSAVAKTVTTGSGDELTIVRTPEHFELYWVKVWASGSGTDTERPVMTLQPAIGG